MSCAFDLAHYAELLAGGYVIAVGDTNIEALERAEAAATLLDVEVE